MSTDIVGYELHDGRLVCEDCATAYEVDELELPVCYYHPKAEEPCDVCGLRLDGEPNERSFNEDTWEDAHPERPHDTALIGCRRDR